VQDKEARPFNWDDVALAVFDVDGTLYRQSPLRLLMAADMLVHAVRRRDLSPLKVLRVYRKLREELGDAETDGFDPILVERTAAATAISADDVRALVAEWMERRPLVHLGRCRYPALVELFTALRQRGIKVGILSDYPVEAKLEKLGLTADHVVWAGEPAVGILKPHPRGLQHLMALAGSDPTRTVMIGDRAERDGEAARRAGTHALLRSDRQLPGWTTFRRFDDPVFAPLLKA
jgi:putative hydrolase of the HAD superfamily